MKKLIILLAVALCLLFPAGALAQTTVDANIVQAFSHDGKLYAYLTIDGWDGVPLTAKIRIGNENGNDAQLVSAVKDHMPPIHYLFLVDNSTSMPAFKKQISQIVREIMDDAGEQSQFLLATFGKGFDAQEQFTSDKNSVISALSEVKFDAGQTGLYEGISSAIDYYDRLGRTDGEISVIVVFSDGVEVDKKGVTFDEINSKIGGSAVTICTVGFPNTLEVTKEASEQALKNLGVFARTSAGVHNVLGYDGKTEKTVAADISGYFRSLYQVEFVISSFTSAQSSYPVTLFFSAGNEIVGKAEKNIAIEQKFAPQSTLPPENTAQEPNTQSSPVPQEPADDPGKGGSADNPGWFTGNILYLIGAAVLLLAAGLFAVAAKKKKRRAKRASADGIYMRLEVLNGHPAKKGREYFLKNELLIGRDTDCDILFSDRDVSKKNSRIFVRENIIYIEDLGSQNGTAISDMRLHAPNRLRSGDVISIGTVKFVLKF